MNRKTPLLAAIMLALSLPAFAAQQAPANDMTAPLHLMKPDYPTPYGTPTVAEVTKVLDRVFNYLDAVTPAKVIDKNTNQEIKDFSKLDDNSVFAPGDYRLTSYEWGVTYAGMLAAGMSPSFADAVLETARSFNEGEPWGSQQRTVRNTTPTTLAQWARQAFAEGEAR